MQWLLQDFADTRQLAVALDRLGISHTWHRVVPFEGTLLPEPKVTDPNRVFLVGSYALRHYARAKGYRPGVLTLTPFLEEDAWHPYLLNGSDSTIVTLRDVRSRLPHDEASWFVRPIDDSKALAGQVMRTHAIIDLAEGVLALDPAETPPGSLRHDTPLMLAKPVHILKEWRVWIVGGRVVTYSLYKEGTRVTYRSEIDEDALAFAKDS